MTKRSRAVSHILLILFLILLCGCIIGFGVAQVYTYVRPMIDYYTTPDNAEVTLQMGTAGKLIIRDLRIFLPLDGDALLPASEDTQSIVDEPEKGAIFQIESITYVADHSYQTFMRLPWVKRGTRAEIYLISGEVWELECIATGHGYNESTQLTLQDGTPIEEIAAYPNAVVMYTCLSANGHKVFLSFWKRLPKQFGCQ